MAWLTVSAHWTEESRCELAAAMLNLAHRLCLSIFVATYLARVLHQQHAAADLLQQILIIEEIMVYYCRLTKVL